ncbi:ABC transporter substrate-binding protein, partial [bacterium]|nr:ABC transporter substrate-binding protein [bacterium]
MLIFSQTHIISLFVIGLSFYRRQQSPEVTGLRIVSLSPAITEILFELGVGGQIVGVSEHSDYPPEAKKIPWVGRYDEPNIELILQAKAALVVG